MLQRSVLAQRKHFGGRFEGLRNGIIVNGLRPSATCGRRFERHIADGDGDEVAELTVLRAATSASSPCSTQAMLCNAHTDGSSHGRSRRWPEVLALEVGAVSVEAIHPARVAQSHTSGHSFGGHATVYLAARRKHCSETLINVEVQ